MSSWTTSVQALDVMRTVFERSPALFRAIYRGKPSDYLALKDASCRDVEDWDDLASSDDWSSSHLAGDDNEILRALGLNDKTTIKVHSTPVLRGFR